MLRSWCQHESTAQIRPMYYVRPGVWFSLDEARCEIGFAIVVARTPTSQIVLRWIRNISGRLANTDTSAQACTVVLPRLHNDRPTFGVKAQDEGYKQAHETEH